MYICQQEGSKHLLAASARRGREIVEGVRKLVLSSRVAAEILENAGDDLDDELSHHDISPAAVGRH